MKHLKVLLIATTWALSCAAALGQNAPAQNKTAQEATPGLITGRWTVTFTVQGQTVSGEMTFRTRGEKLDGNVETKHTGRGTLQGGAWSQDKISGIYVFESHQAIAIAGELREGKLAGVFRTEGLDGKWEALPASTHP